MSLDEDCETAFHDRAEPTTAPSLTPAVLQRIGTFLFGKHFAKDIARMLGIEQRSVHRYLTGERPIPQEFRRPLADALSAAVEANLPQHYAMLGEGAEQAINYTAHKLIGQMFRT